MYIWCISTNQNCHGTHFREWTAPCAFVESRAEKTGKCRDWYLACWHHQLVTSSRKLNCILLWYLGADSVCCLVRSMGSLRFLCFCRWKVTICQPKSLYPRDVRSRRWTFTARARPSSWATQSLGLCFWCQRGGWVQLPLSALSGLPSATAEHQRANLRGVLIRDSLVSFKCFKCYLWMIDHT